MRKACEEERPRGTAAVEDAIAMASNALGNETMFQKQVIPVAEE